MSMCRLYERIIGNSVRMCVCVSKNEFQHCGSAAAREAVDTNHINTKHRRKFHIHPRHTAEHQACLLGLLSALHDESLVFLHHFLLRCFSLSSLFHPGGVLLMFLNSFLYVAVLLRLTSYNVAHTELSTYINGKRE